MKAVACKCSNVLSLSLTFDCDNVSIVLGNGILGEIGIIKLAKQNNSRTFISLKSRKKLKKKKGKVMIFSQQKYQPGLKVEVEASEVL